MRVKDRFTEDEISLIQKTYSDLSGREKHGTTPSKIKGMALRALVDGDEYNSAGKDDEVARCWIASVVGVLVNKGYIQWPAGGKDEG